MDFIRNTKGFTLIEFIIVITITLIIATVGFVKWISKPFFTVASGAELLADDIRYAQSFSMSRGQHYQIIFKSPSSNTYRILDASDNPITLSSGLLYNTLPAGVVFSSISIPNGSSEIVFDGLGKPYSDADTTLPFTTIASIAIASGTISKTITVDPETGRVSIQ